MVRKLLVGVALFGLAAPVLWLAVVSAGVKYWENRSPSELTMPASEACSSRDFDTGL